MTKDQVITALRDEIIRQSKVPLPAEGPWVRVSSPACVQVDGYLDLNGLADVIMGAEMDMNDIAKLESLHDAARKASETALADPTNEAKLKAARDASREERLFLEQHMSMRST